MKKRTPGKVKKITHPFFKGIPPKFQKTILDCVSLVKLKKGESIFRDGEKADHFYLILTGEVNILSKEQDVRFDSESNVGVLQLLKPGEVVGWSWLIPPYRWRFDAVAEEDVQLLALPALKLRKQIERDSHFGYEIYKRLVPVMNSRLIAARLKLEMFGTQPFTSEEGG